MSGDKAQLMLLVENVIYNQETHTNNGEAHEWMPLLFITRKHRFIFFFFSCTYHKKAVPLPPKTLQLIIMKTIRSFLSFKNMIFMIMSFVFVITLASCKKNACPYCDGTGKVYIQNDPNSTPVVATCPICNGRGYNINTDY